MSKRLRFLLFALLCALPCFAQYSTIVATKLKDAGGAPLASGEFCATLKNVFGQTGNILLPAGGQAISSPVCRDVTAGALTTTYKTATLGALQLADMSLTNPTYQCYKVVVTNNADKSVVLGSTGSFKSAYDCVQPTGSTWSFDTFVPPGVPGVPQYTGGGVSAGGGLADPGANGIVKRTALNTTAAATAGDIGALIGGQTGCSTAGYVWDVAESKCVVNGAAFVYGADITSVGGVLDSDGSHATSTGCNFFGDSITQGAGNTVAANAYAALMTSRICGGVANNYAAGGDRASDGIYRVLSNINPGDSNVAATTLMLGVNDAIYSPSPTSTNQKSFYQFEGGAAAWLGLSSTNKVLVNNTTYVTQGGAAWAASTTFADANGLTTTGTSTLTDSACFIGTKGVLYLWYYLYGTSTGTFTVTVDGVTQTDTITGNTTLSAQYQSNAPQNIGTTTAGLARFSGLTHGSHSCVVNASGATSNPVGMIAFGFPPVNRLRTPTGPNVYMGGVIPQNNNNNSTAVTAYNGYALGISTLLVGDGLPVKFVDVYDAMDPYLDMTGTASQNCAASTNVGLHPNDCGHNKLFDVFAASMKPSTIIPLNQTMSFPNLWNWNPSSSAGGTNAGEVFYNHNNNTTGITFGGVSSNANIAAAVPSPYATMLFAGNQFTIGISICDAATSATTLAGLTCTQQFSGGNLYFLPPSSTNATSGSNVSSSSLYFRGMGWNGSSAAVEDYTLQTVYTSSGSTADAYLVAKNTNAATTGAKGLWVQNSGGHGWKLAAGASFDITLNSTPVTADRSYVTPDGAGAWAVSASLTSTAAASDTLTVQGMTASGHCSLTATNSSAATNIATSYVSAKAANQITVTHTATSGMTYDAICTPN